MVSLFPGGLNQEDTKKNGDLALELVDAFMMAPSALKESVIEEVRSRLPVVPEDKKTESSNIIRFDLCMAAPFPTDMPRQLWIDHAIVHESSASYQEEVINHLEGGEFPTSHVAFRRTETSKKRRFRSLIAICPPPTETECAGLSAILSVSGGVGSRIPEQRHGTDDEVDLWSLQQVYRANTKRRRSGDGSDQGQVQGRSAERTLLWPTEGQCTRHELRGQALR
jgi:hypothetical protein